MENPELYLALMEFEKESGELRRAFNKAISEKQAKYHSMIAKYIHAQVAGAFRHDVTEIEVVFSDVADEIDWPYELEKLTFRSAEGEERYGEWSNEYWKGLAVFIDDNSVTLSTLLDSYTVLTIYKDGNYKLG